MNRDKTPLTPLEHALLGLLDLAPGSGYDVRKIFETTPMEHFSSSPGAIYPALKRLEKRGFLQATLDTTKEARPRRVFSLTEAGRQALLAWLRQPVTRDELVRDGKSPMLRFSLAGGKLSRGELISYLEGLEQEVRDYLEELYRHRRELPEDIPLHIRLSLEHGIRGYEAQRHWVEHAISEIKKQNRVRPGAD